MSSGCYPVSSTKHRTGKEFESCPGETSSSSIFFDIRGLDSSSSAGFSWDRRCATHTKYNWASGSRRIPYGEAILSFEFKSSNLRVKNTDHGFSKFCPIQVQKETVRPDGHARLSTPPFGCVVSVAQLTTLRYPSWLVALVPARRGVCTFYSFHSSLGSTYSPTPMLCYLTP